LPQDRNIQIVSTQQIVGASEFICGLIIFFLPTEVFCLHYLPLSLTTQTLIIILASLKMLKQFKTKKRDVLMPLNFLIKFIIELYIINIVKYF